MADPNRHEAIHPASGQPDRSDTILIVDDNPANLGVLSDLLDAEGFEVRVAKSGQIALERVNYARPHLILLDVMMPGIDGFETCRQLKADPTVADIPVIFMTALGDSQSKVTGINAGAVDYITKPFQQEEVVARVRLHLRLHHLTQDLAAHNATLEQRVAERTQALQSALDNLKQTQVQLVQSEKMSSLGQLVAGGAHEINNPVNFICGNLGHAEAYGRQLAEVLQLYQQHYPDPAPEIAEKIEDYDLGFVLADLPKLNQSMQLGAKRIKEIVHSLRAFSRLDQASRQTVDIHQGIDSTLMILQCRLKAKADRPKIEVVKDYQGPNAIPCYPGPLNQVFMNLLSNAVDALETASGEAKVAPRIEIHTRQLENGWVEIAIADNGDGMATDQQQKLFEPFFTTKPIGKGTGMGLAISRTIVTDQHQGQLHCQSVAGQGTTFLIQFPVPAIATEDQPTSALLV